MKKKSRNYVNNKDLYDALVAYRLSNFNPNTKDAKYIGEALLLIATKLATKPRFMSYSYKDEMIMDGMYDCMLYGVHKFDPKYTNPFAYFTQIIKQAFYRKINKERKEQYIKYKLLEEKFIVDEMDELVHTKKIVQENMQIYIRDYETAIVEKKKKDTLIGIEKFTE